MKSLSKTGTECADENLALAAVQRRSSQHLALDMEDEKISDMAVKIFQRLEIMHQIGYLVSALPGIGQGKSQPFRHSNSDHFGEKCLSKYHD